MAVFIPPSAMEIRSTIKRTIFIVVQSLTPMNTFYIGDSLCIQNGMKFTTKDQDNDEYSPFNCATNFHGAWWYENCHDSYLNENYLGGYLRRILHLDNIRVLPLSLFNFETLFSVISRKWSVIVSNRHFRWIKRIIKTFNEYFLYRRQPMYTEWYEIHYKRPRQRWI
jgi:hypothetical protein